MAVVNAIKNDYVRMYGLALAIEEYRPSRYDGAKEERISAVLQHRYHNRQIWHYQGGHCQTLEEELVLSNPSHDDIKDCLATVIDMCIAPTSGKTKEPLNTMISVHPRFGGVY